jgi:hypothetical protein
MSERAARAWRFYIDDMVTFATKVLMHVDGEVRLQEAAARGSTLAASRHCSFVAMDGVIAPAEPSS